jgi:hypothetical protein
MSEANRVQPVTATSLTSFSDAAEQALTQLPPGPEGLKSARVVAFSIEQGGVVGRTQYRATLEQTYQGA